MKKSVRIVLTAVILCTLLITGVTSATASSCQLPISIRGNTDLREHTHILRVFTSPSNIDKVQLYFDEAQKKLDSAGASDSEKYIDYYISTWFVITHPKTWNDTGRWYATQCSEGHSGGGGGGGGGGSW